MFLQPRAHPGVAEPVATLLLHLQGHYQAPCPECGYLELNCVNWGAGGNCQSEVEAGNEEPGALSLPTGSSKLPVSEEGPWYLLKALLDLSGIADTIMTGWCLVQGWCKPTGHMRLVLSVNIVSLWARQRSSPAAYVKYSSVKLLRRLRVRVSFISFTRPRVRLIIIKVPRSYLRAIMLDVIDCLLNKFVSNPLQIIVIFQSWPRILSAKTMANRNLSWQVPGVLDAILWVAASPYVKMTLTATQWYLCTIFQYVDLTNLSTSDVSSSWTKIYLCLKRKWSHSWSPSFKYACLTFHGLTGGVSWVCDVIRF